MLLFIIAFQGGGVTTCNFDTYIPLFLLYPPVPTRTHNEGARPYFFSPEVVNVQVKECAFTYNTSRHTRTHLSIQPESEQKAWRCYTQSALPQQVLRTNLCEGVNDDSHDPSLPSVICHLPRGSPQNKLNI